MRASRNNGLGVVEKSSTFGFGEDTTLRRVQHLVCSGR
jgi:hypothetical protein